VVRKEREGGKRGRIAKVSDDARGGLAIFAAYGVFREGEERKKRGGKYQAGLGGKRKARYVSELQSISLPGGEDDDATNAQTPFSAGPGKDEMKLAPITRSEFLMSAKM